MVAACRQPVEKTISLPVGKDAAILYAPVKGYAFKKSPAAFSVVHQAVRKPVPLPEPIVHDSTGTLSADTAALDADEVPPTYEGAPFFVVTTDSAFNTMVLQSNGKPTVPDSATTPVDFSKEFLLVLYAPPAAMTEASADLSVDAVVPDAGVLYVSTSSYYSVPADSMRRANPFWQVSMYKIERRDFRRVGIVAEDTTYFGL
jgi:hypothetical protein